jgi:hypothetical protein
MRHILAFVVLLALGRMLLPIAYAADGPGADCLPESQSCTQSVGAGNKGCPDAQGSNCFGPAGKPNTGVACDGSNGQDFDINYCVWTSDADDSCFGEETPCGEQVEKRCVPTGSGCDIDPNDPGTALNEECEVIQCTPS